MDIGVNPVMIVGYFIKEITIMIGHPEEETINYGRRNKMKKYMWFFIGYMTAIATIFIASCTITPLQADYSTPGHSEAFPLYVKVID